MSTNVLYIEDDEIAVKVVSRAVGHLGAVAVIAQTGAQALALLDAGEKFAVVVADLHLPDMKGATIIERIRARRPILPLIALTGCAMPGEREACLAAGCTIYVTKPYEPDALEALLARYVQGAPA